MLYIGLGDGGGAGDPHGNGAEPRRAARQDPAHRPDAARATRRTAFPRTTRSSDAPARSPRSGCTGLRNPWRFSFDRATGDLWIGDVGQDAYEEIDYAPQRRSRASTGAGTSARALHEFKGSRPAGRATRSSRPRTTTATARSSAATCTAVARSPRSTARTCSATTAAPNIDGVVQRGGRAIAAARPRDHRRRAHDVRRGRHRRALRRCARRHDLQASPASGRASRARARLMTAPPRRRVIACGVDAREGAQHLVDAAGDHDRAGSSRARRARRAATSSASCHMNPGTRSRGHVGACPGTRCA